MKAIVMAGGFGNRLHPLTRNCPKPMLPLINQPVLGHILDLLKQHHFSEVIITTYYLPEQIQDYFGDGRDRGMALQYSVEEFPLGTAGSVKNAQPYLDDESFLVISGDIVTDIDLSQVVQFHRKKDALATLALTHVAEPSEYGVVVTDHVGHIRQYLEKPSHRQVNSNCVNTGIYVLEPELLDDIKPNTVCDFSNDIFPQMVKRNEALFGYLAGGYWRDMGTMQSYRQCLVDMRAGKVGPMREATYAWRAMNPPPRRANTAHDLLEEQGSGIGDTLQRKVPALLLAQ